MAICTTNVFDCLSSDKCDDVSLNSLMVGSDTQSERTVEPEIECDYERPVVSIRILLFLLYVSLFSNLWLVGNEVENGDT